MATVFSATVLTAGMTFTVMIVVVTFSSGIIVEITCYEGFNRLVKQMAEREGLTEQLKVDNQMEWVSRMNNIRQRATEIVNHDIIYV